jgi:hypothetical protein
MLHECQVDSIPIDGDHIDSPKMAIGAIFESVENTELAEQPASDFPLARRVGIDKS